MLTRLFLLFAFAIAPMAQAQTAPIPVQSDLDGDELVETFLLLYPDVESTHLLIAVVNKPTITAKNIVWRGGYGQEPYLSVAANGSVQLTSGNDAIGRSRWSLTQTIAFRDNAYRVVGLTYSWRDTLDLSVGGTCDVNLLNGRGIRNLVGQSEQSYRIDMRSVPVTEWDESLIFDGNSDLPSICGS